MGHAELRVFLIYSIIKANTSLRNGRTKYPHDKMSIELHGKEKDGRVKDR